MPVINFKDARKQVTGSAEWLQAVSNYIKDPQGEPAPADLLLTQKLAFEIDKSELAALMDQDRVIGILSMEPENTTLSVVLVGLTQEYTPTSNVLPVETFPKLNLVSELQAVLEKYLTPDI